MTRYRLTQDAVAFGLSILGLGCGAWLIVKALAEITRGVALPAVKR